MTSINKQTKPISAESIVACAAKLFRKKGFRNTTLEQIAEDFGVTRQAIYYYFQSKNDILFAIVNTMNDNFINNMGEVLNKDLPPHEKFIQAAMAHVRGVTRNPTYVAIWQEERKQLPEDVSFRFHHTFLNYHNIMFDLYKQGVDSGHFKDVDPKMAVLTILGACHWTYFWYRADKFPGPEQLASQMLELFTEGFYIGRDTTEKDK